MNEFENKQTATPQQDEASNRRSSKRRPPRPEDMEQTLDVSVRGQGKRPSDDVSSAATPHVEAVVVESDFDFEAAMESFADSRLEERRFRRGDQITAVVEVISSSGPEVFLDLGGTVTGYVLKEELQNEEGELLVKVGDQVEGVVAGEDSNGIQIKTRMGQESGREELRAAFEAGLTVQGKVTGHNKGGYEVSIANMRGFCPHSQLSFLPIEDPESMVGQSFDFRILEFKEHDDVILSHTAILKEAREKEAKALLSQIAVGARMKGQVRSIQSFGAFVDLGGKDGLVHISEIAWERVEDPNEVLRIGQEVEVIVTEFNEATEKIGLSIRQALPDPIETIGAKLQVGETLSGKVTRMKDFGVFVELAPGLDGFIHISDLAHYRVRHPKDLLKIGEIIQVKVLEVQLETRRIKLSLKALDADPWDGIETRYPVGAEIKGRVESVRDFGVFVEVEKGVTALLPASESQTEGRPLASEFRVGQDLAARILSIDPQDRKMALTRRSEEELKARPSKTRERRMKDLGIEPQKGSAWERGSGKSRVYYEDKPLPGEAPMSAMAEALMKALKKD